MNFIYHQKSFYLIFRQKSSFFYYINKIIYFTITLNFEDICPIMTYIELITIFIFLFYMIYKNQIPASALQPGALFYVKKIDQLR